MKQLLLLILILPLIAFAGPRSRQLLTSEKLIEQLRFTQEETGPEFTLAQYEGYPNPNAWTIETAQRGAKKRLERLLHSGVDKETELFYLEYIKENDDDFIVKIFVFKSVKDRDRAFDGAWVQRKNRQLKENGLPPMAKYKNCLYHITSSTAKDIAVMKRLNSLLEEKLKKIR